MLDKARIVAKARQRQGDMIDEYRAEIILLPSWPLALGHAPWLEQVWANYLSNAVRYGGRPPHIELGAEVEEAGMVRFWVRDRGKVRRADWRGE